jgi:hypothetical protein
MIKIEFHILSTAFGNYALGTVSAASQREKNNFMVMVEGRRRENGSKERKT